MSVGNQFRRHKGLFDGLSPTKQISMSPKWTIKHYKSVDFSLPI